MMRFILKALAFILLLDFLHFMSSDEDENVEGTKEPL